MSPISDIQQLLVECIQYIAEDDGALGVSKAAHPLGFQARKLQ